MEVYLHISLALVEDFLHHSVMALTKRLDKRYAVEGDELAKEAADAIRELRAALQALVLDQSKGLRQARAALAKHR